MLNILQDKLGLSDKLHLPAFQVFEAFQAKLDIKYKIAVVFLNNKICLNKNSIFHHFLTEGLFYNYA